MLSARVYDKVSLVRRDVDDVDDVDDMDDDFESRAHVVLETQGTSRASF